MGRYLELVLSLAFTTIVVSASDVLVFTDADFSDKVKEHDIILIEFYAPWCGHCKQLAPEYEKAATKLKSNDPPVSLAKVDCTVEKESCEKHGVSGFPTLKVFRRGEVSGPYEGPREADGIVKYMRSQVGPSSKELNSFADLEKFLSGDEHSIIGFFEKETKLKDSFLKVADTERDRYRFGYTTTKALIEKYNYNDDIVIFQPKRLQNKFEDPQTRYDGNYDTEKIKKFLTTQMNGLCGHRTSDNMASFEKPLVIAYYNVDYVKDLKGTNYWRNRILKVAQDYKRKVHFAVADKDDFSHELDEYGLAERKTSADKPLITGQGAGGEKYSMEEDFSPENLKKFVDDLLAEKLTPFMKSEEIPDDNDVAPVKVAVAKNFKELVDKSDKDVLIEFYAPWCGHCKSLAPTFDKLGEKMKAENVLIVKMDATANDVPPAFAVSGFPTLYWAPKGRKNSPVPYNGGRDLEDFIKFIAKESTDELKGWTRDGKKRKKTEL